MQLCERALTRDNTMASSSRGPLARALASGVERMSASLSSLASRGKAADGEGEALKEKDASRLCQVKPIGLKKFQTRQRAVV